MDFAFSFWTLTKITQSHPNWRALASAGIIYTCTCPQFMHYHVCKHVIGFAMYQDNLAVPTEFSKMTVGKRSAPAGAKLMKRGHCLAIDM